MRFQMKRKARVLNQKFAELFLSLLLAPSPIPLPPPGRCEKIAKRPLTLPSPARGEGKDVEIQEEIPSPSTGEGEGGGEKGIFSHLGREGRVRGEGGIVETTLFEFTEGGTGDEDL